MRVLVVEDHEGLAGHITAGLAKAGYAADAVSTLDDASAALQAASYDLILLDLGLPDGDGVGWLKKKRSEGTQIPVLIVTARDALGDRIKGLDSGGDDYLVKPFAMEELLARCRALLRRPSATENAILEANGIALDLATRAVRINDRLIELGRRETNLLELLLRRAGSVVTREAIEGQIYSFDDEVTPNALEAATSRLRRRLEEAGSPARIHTVRGVGYLLKTD
jgi:DNA-binding response OmpR family regulator